MNSNQLISVQYTKLLWSYKTIIIRNVFFVAILTSIMALIIPEGYPFAGKQLIEVISPL